MKELWLSVVMCCVMAVSDFFVGDVLLDFELRIKDKSKIRFC